MPNDPDHGESSIFSDEDRPPRNCLLAPHSSSISKTPSSTRPVGRPPKELVQDHLQSTIGDGFRIVTKRAHNSTSSPSNSIPSSSPPTKSPNLLQDTSQPSHQTKDGEVTSAEDLPSSAEAPTVQFLLQRISALEAYVTAQDQRILHLEAEIERINGPPSTILWNPTPLSKICKQRSPLSHPLPPRPPTATLPLRDSQILPRPSLKSKPSGWSAPNPLSSEIEIQTPQPSIILPVHMITNRRNPSAPG